MSEPRITLGLKANWQQFTLLVLVNAFVGALVGQERTIVPLIADREFGLASSAVILSFIISFGLIKALANLLAGRYSDRIGRKRILIAGWLAGLPVPFLLIFAPSWGWVVLANVLLGMNQGLCWSTTVIMKIDVVGPKQRGLAMGLNEFAGYLSVSLAAFLTGYLAAGYGLRPVPFYPGIAFAVMGLALSFFFVRETREYAQHESQLRAVSADLSRGPAPSFAEILLLTSWRDRALFAASQAGMVNNLNDGLVWGLIPIYLTSAGLPLAQVAVITGIYPGVWGASQLVTGALSDHWGRKWLIAAGMWVQAVGIVLFVLAHGFLPWLGGAVLLGAGTALVYPTLLAAIGDVARPDWRATAVGVYRLWRDGGYAVGALASGLLADAWGIPTAIAAVAALTFVSGLIVALVMYETLNAGRGHAPTATVVSQPDAAAAPQFTGTRL